MKPCPGKSFDTQVKKLAKIIIDFNFEKIKTYLKRLALATMVPKQ